MMEEERIIMGALLSALSHPRLSDLTHSILSATHHQCHRLSSIVSSPSLFSLTLHHLHSLTLPDKTLLIARHLLVSLHHLTRYVYPSPSQASTGMNQRDLDAALLLLLLCEVQQHNPETLREPVKRWQGVLSEVLCNRMLSISGVGVGVIPFVEMVTRSLRFVGGMGCCCCGGEKEGTYEVAASREAVIALPSVEVEVREGQVVVEKCVICREEMKQGREVCELPCGHLFHWICILPWLTKRSTCPCCRFQLPTDDVFCEIQRLWSSLLLNHSLSHGVGSSS
ncbi:E3 ubiquitin-protein ligase SGR9 amyloplastic [Tripterygium wilfordii]|uniref:RING-type E3 ubiquitin transferase n=1 Tax=Tripterygium wilfordii TaxID=458696 RepID=A0A7J7CT35_TRIWF|nr:E3 ubiquitin-protein ligase SGR9, amyloplastic [Tripterygium wilfordii]KAF5737129.1 E3 ubiquitin-protein ligase SGR9 amyloplastic [Tripterygium wilfordii]